MTIIVDGVVEELVTQGVNSLVRIVSDNVTLVRGINSEIKDLTSDIQMFNARLIEASKNPRANDHQVLRLIVNKFRSVVNEAEDTIADYVVLKKKHGNNFFLKSLDRTPFCGKVNGYASEIQSIRTKMNAIRQDHEKEVQDLMQYEIKEQDKAVKTFHQARPSVEKNEVYGFDEYLRKIKTRLLEASDHFSVIPIVGMAGTGKTTFASMLYDDLSTLNNSVCIWVPVSKWCDIKQKFISIIYQITKSTEDLTTKPEEMLRDTIQTLLKDRKYFIILDDVWEKKDWDSLQIAFPKNMNGSRVLVTTRHDNVVDSTWKSHNLGKLSDDEGWLLIKNNVFGTEGCNDTLENLGRKIAIKCKGLPLALVVVAGILRKCITSTDWQRVADNPLLEINREDQSYHEIVKMSYYDLPHEKLKNCFLYFAYFPMGHEISIWKLVCLWIAEGFIPTINEWEYPIDAEVEAQKYLNDLVDRNLVMVIKRRADGQIKTCRIHDTLHEFCKSEAARKNLFLVMDKEERIDENTCSTRRLCFHSFTAGGISDDENISSRFFVNWDNQMRSLLSPFGKHIHSLFLSSPQKSDEVPLTRDELAAIPNIFPLLRVLNNEYIKFNDDMLPKEVYRLYLLKYIAISGNLSRLPKSFKNLVELETLVIKTTARTLQIEGGIWNMEKLRHVRTNTSTQLPFPPETNSKTNSGGKHIHTLSTISPASCKKEIFSKTPNLRKLGVRGNLSEFLEKKEDICLFNNVQMLKCLVNLKLYGQYDKVLTVPMLDKFARRLKKLSFSGTLFEWKDMEVLGKLEELEVLKLDDYAFKGENWELSNNVVFRRLQYLRIGRTNLVNWNAPENSFPALQSLILQNCYVIKKIPKEFANVHTLKVMELFHISESATQSAEEIRKNIKNDGFKLIITSQKREGAMTAARDTLIEQAVSEAVNLLVERVEWWVNRLVERGVNGGLEWEIIKNWTSDIETFNARLEEAYKNPTQSVNVLIVKNFQTIVNEAWDAFDNWFTVYYIHQEHKTFIRKFMVPREVKSCESEIQSLRTKVNTIDQEHKKELETLCNYENNAPLTSKESTVYDRKIEDIDQQVNMLRKKIENNVNGVCDIVYEIKDMTSQIKTFLEDLMKACKNPKANEHRVLKVIVKKFGILVNETMDAVTDYFAQEKKHGNNALAKSLDKIIAHCGKSNAYASGIPFIKERVKSIREDHTKDLLHLSEDYNKRGGAMTATRDTVIKQAVSEAVNELVVKVERWSLNNGGIEWEIKSLTSDIETFNARLEQAYKNPTQSVNILIVKNFQTIVSEARDAVFNWRRYFNDRRELKSCESEIQSVRTKVNTIDHEHKKELETLCNYENNNNAPLIFQD